VLISGKLFQPSLIFVSRIKTLYFGGIHLKIGFKFNIIAYAKCWFNYATNICIRFYGATTFSIMPFSITTISIKLIPSVIIMLSVFYVKCHN
jgi:hypothetical protein